MRLFFAIDLGSEVMDAVARAQERVRPLAPRARWSKPEATHLTLAFLGEQPEEQLPMLAAAADQAAAGLPPFLLTVKGAGVFGPPRRPRVLWLGVEGELSILRTLEHRLTGQLAAGGITLPDESKGRGGQQPRPYSPHLTLARAGDPRGEPRLVRCVEALAGVECGSARVDRLILFQSQPGPKGYTYLQRAEALLQPSTQPSAG